MEAQDWRYPTDKERQYGLAYLRWLGRFTSAHRRPAPVPQAFGVAPDRARQIRDDIEQMARAAAAALGPGRLGR